MTDAGRIIAMLTEVLRRLDTLNTPLEAPLTRKAFGKRIGKSAHTISRWIRDRKVRTEKGMIPYSELRKFLS